MRRVAQGQRAIASELAESAWSAPVVLTDREREILRLVEEGKSNKEIARDLEITEPTIKLHVKTLYRKLDVNNRTQAAIVARDAGIF